MECILFGMFLVCFDSLHGEESAYKPSAINDFLTGIGKTHGADSIHNARRPASVG